MAPSQHVLIVGGGLAGLSLAHGLKKHGISCRVFERDISPDFRPQGYRLRINHFGATALQKLLSDDIWKLFEDTSASFELGMTGMNAIDASVTMTVTGRASDPSTMKIPGPIVGPYSADRKTLRDLLLLGLEDEVEFGKKFTRSETNGTDQVTVYFEDGTHVQGTLLVAADGIRSSVRRQHIPNFKLLDTTCRCIYGKTLITPQLTETFPKEGLRWITAIRDSRPMTLFLEPMRFESSIKQTSKGKLADVSDYVYWGLLSRQANFNISDEELFSMSGREVANLTLTLTEEWDESIRSLIKNQVQDESSALRFVSSLPIMEEWESSPVITFIGDAIHPMPPAGGSGANTAFRDAARLLEAIVGGANAEDIRKYEADMREYAGQAIMGSWGGGKSICNMPGPEECKTVDL